MLGNVNVHNFSIVLHIFEKKCCSRKIIYNKRNVFILGQEYLNCVNFSLKGDLLEFFSHFYCVLTTIPELITLLL